MQVKISQNFKDDFAQIKDPSLKDAIRSVIKKLLSEDNQQQNNLLRPISGHPGYFKIGVGIHSLGVWQVAPDTLFFMRLAHREQIFEAFKE